MIGFENITTRIEQINSLAYALEGAIIEAAGPAKQSRCRICSISFRVSWYSLQRMPTS